MRPQGRSTRSARSEMDDCGSYSDVRCDPSNVIGVVGDRPQCWTATWLSGSRPTFISAMRTSRRSRELLRCDKTLRPAALSELADRFTDAKERAKLLDVKHLGDGSPAVQPRAATCGSSLTASESTRSRGPWSPSAATANANGAQPEADYPRSSCLRSVPPRAATCCVLLHRPRDSRGIALRSPVGEGPPRASKTVADLWFSPIPPSSGR